MIILQYYNIIVLFFSMARVENAHPTWSEVVSFVFCSAETQGLCSPETHGLCSPETHGLCAGHAKKFDFRIETSGVRDETWWKFRAMPGEFLRQNQQIEEQQSILIMGPEEEAKFEKSFRGPKLGLQSSVRGGVRTV